MPCPRCKETPGFHSFTPFGTINSIKIFYTSPNKSQDTNSDGTRLENLKIHMLEDTGGKPWIWFFDCSHISLTAASDIKSNIDLITFLSHNKNLKKIYVLQPDLLFRAALTTVKGLINHPLLSEIHYIEGSPLELMVSLNKLGFDIVQIKSLLRQ